MNKFIPQIFILLLVLTSADYGLAQPEEPNPEEVATEQLMQTIAVWAGAWQSQLPDLYIAHYTPEYYAPGFTNRTAWLEDRRKRLVEPEFIKIRLIDFDLVSLEESFATVRFTLVYERPDYSDETYKELTLNNSNGIWLIEEEENLEVKVL